MSIIFKITSFNESKNLLTGFAFSEGINIMEMPNNIEKNIT